MDTSYVTSWGDAGASAPDLFIRYAGGTLPYPKLVSSSIGTVFAPEMMPTDLYVVSQQGPTTTDVLLSEFGGCPAPTQESFSVGVPPSASQMFDTTFGLPVPGALQAGDSVRAIRSTRGSTRFVIHRQAPRQRRLPYLSSVHGGAAIGTKGYGDFPYTDEHGITHQPVGRVDPVVNRTQINVLYDGKTVKLNASTNQLYADILGMDAVGSASDTVPPGPLHAGRGLVITPGPGPADPPAVTMEAGGSIEDGAYQWAWSIMRGGKETGLSPGKTGTAGAVTTGGVTTTYRSASIDLPGVLTGDPATAVKLYRRDTSIGADGTIHTKFVYASHGVGVLVSDPSVGAVVSDTGSLTGYYLYTVVTTKGPIVAGMMFVYNANAYVTTDDPPLLIDPRDGSTTTLDVSSNGESAFVTSDGGVLNPTNGDITYPTSSAKNLTAFKLVASLAITPLTYVDTLSNTALGATYQRDVQTIHNLPFGGDGIQLHDLEIDDFHHYIVHNIRLATDADNNNVSGLTINAPYVGLPGQDLSITEASGTYPNALAVRLNPDTMEFDSEWRISAIGGGGGITTTLQKDSGGTPLGGTITLTSSDSSVSISENVGTKTFDFTTAGGGGGGSTVAFSAGYDATSGAIPAYSGSGPLSSGDITWTSVLMDHGGWVAAGSSLTGPSVVFPTSGTFAIACDLDTGSGGATPTTGQLTLSLRKNGTEFYADDFHIPLGGSSTRLTVVVPGKLEDFALSDVLHVVIVSSLDIAISVSGGSVNVWKV